MKKGLLTGIIAAMAMSGLTALGTKRSARKVDAQLDARIIVEVNGSKENLTRDQIESSQDKVMKAISKKVTGNFKLIHRYSVLNNAFVVEVSSDDIEKIRNLDEVASVTLDEIHAKQSLDSGEMYSVKFERPSKGLVSEDSGDAVDNISAETMNKPDGTADGEGTVIAILDNEFYLRGEHMPDSSKGDDGSPWNHVVYKPLDNNVKTRFTFENLEAALNDEENPMTARRLKGSEAGQEGSLYFNNKVPFYFDYGGESLSYGKVGPTDYDVSSLLTYHGSHVASIASANADTYKGIAPKAQLACMKVFTTYVADDDNFSLAIGKKGMNARLASRLTKYKIEVKNMKEAQEMGINIKGE